MVVLFRTNFLPFCLDHPSYYTSLFSVRSNVSFIAIAYTVENTSAKTLHVYAHKSPPTLSELEIWNKRLPENGVSECGTVWDFPQE